MRGGSTHNNAKLSLGERKKTTQKTSHHENKTTYFPDQTPTSDDKEISPALKKIRDTSGKVKFKHLVLLKYT